MKCLYYHNGQSGNNKIEKKKDYIVSRLKTKFERVDCFDNNTRLLMLEKLKANEKEYDAIIFSGGDGTVNNMINDLKDLKNPPILGYIPSGTVNDFAKNLGLNKNVKKSLDAILCGKNQSYDCFKVGEELGIYVCGTGIFTTASYKANHEEKKKFGKFAYYAKSIKELFTKEAYEVLITKEDGTQIKAKSILTLLINSKSVAGYKFNKKADLHDGKMELVCVKQEKDKLTFKSLLTIIKMFLFGIKSVLKNKNVEYFKFEKLKISFNNPQTINLDGENGGQEDIDICVLNNKFKFYYK